MKQNSNFLLRTVADSLVLVPVGEATEKFPGMISMNATGAFLWEQLADDQTEASLTQALLDKYEVSEEKARQDVQGFLKTLSAIGAVL